MALIDVVQWQNKPGEIIYRFPEGAISMAAQLIVMEQQEAVFFREGRALEALSAVIARCGDELRKEFPGTAADTNELPDGIML